MRCFRSEASVPAMSLARAEIPVVSLGPQIEAIRRRAIGDSFKLGREFTQVIEFYWRAPALHYKKRG